MKYLVERFPFKTENQLYSLVENRTSFNFETCELNVFETQKTARDFHLTFQHFVLTSMLAGKKVMKLRDRERFDYLPGESLILSPGETMVIDFPEAGRNNPTQCIALTISDDLIKQTIDQLNERFPKQKDWGRWEISNSVLHLNNSPALADTVTRMIRISRDEKGKAKDLMVDLTLKEMLIRLMQTQARHIFEHSLSNGESGGPMASTLNFIQNNLTTRIDLDKLADQACMSRASFFKKFKESMGETPLQYIMRKRILYAMKLLSSSNMTVTEICYECGFQNLSHFVTAFRTHTGLTPTMYKNGTNHQA